ncbi:MAG TPA: phosphatidate cytidylyltransferase [Terriglobia bacterium]|nr:phosphatidate cytidylyltransferase [Terriglobia bacterium]
MKVAVVMCMFGAGAILVCAGNRVRQTSTTEARALWVKYWMYAGIVGGFMLCSLDRTLLAAVLLMVAALCVREALRIRSYASAVWVLVSLGFALMTRNFLSLYLVVAATDAFAQLGGRLLGGRLLCPRLSPGKRVSGALCGIVAGAGMGLLLGLQPGAAVAVALAGQAGDLTASKVKRAAGVKDFGNALPGHGGLMDRFDSLWGAAPLGAFLC